MKTWEKPELKVFDVKLNENIAASGEENRPSADGMLRISKGDEAVNTITRVTYYTDTNMIIETDFPYVSNAGGQMLQTPEGMTGTDVLNMINDAGCRP